MLFGWVVGGWKSAVAVVAAATCCCRRPAVVRDTLQGAIATQLLRPHDQVVSLYHRWGLGWLKTFWMPLNLPVYVPVAFACLQVVALVHNACVGCVCRSVTVT